MRTLGKHFVRAFLAHKSRYFERYLADEFSVAYQDKTAVLAQAVYRKRHVRGIVAENGYIVSVVTDGLDHLPATPRVEDNPATLLSQSDLVFLDALGTGWSVLAEDADPKKVFCADGDADAFARAKQNTKAPTIIECIIDRELDNPDLSVEQLRDLNPQYRADIVPAGFGKSYPLRMPYNHVAAFIDRQDTIFAYHRAEYFDESDRTADPQVRFKKHAHVAPANRARLVYTVREGDVIGGIAMKFGVRLNDLKYWNGMTRNLIRVGQKLVIYVPKNKVDYYKSKLDTRYAGSASNNEVEVEPLNEGEYFYYTVKQGDNLWSIAKKFDGISNRDIMRWNGLSEKAVRKLKPGQKLKIKI